jgi:transcriptional regulator with XRE-family HTH domain
MEGDMVQGRKPDLKRRQQVVALRARGLSLLAIGRALGVSRQCVQQILRRMKQPPPVPSVACCGCGCAIISAGALRSDAGKALCLRCLRKSPDVPFGQRLKALRLAAGLTQSELAARTGITPSCLCLYEAGHAKPKSTNRDRLLAGLGAGSGKPTTHPIGKPRTRQPRARGNALPTLTSCAPLSTH